MATLNLELCLLNIPGRPLGVDAGRQKGRGGPDE